MKIAVVHEWLTFFAGSERVLEQIFQCYPTADLFCVADFLPDHQRALILNKTAQTSFIQHLPFAKTRYRNYLPLMPLAIEQLDLSNYDLVISSNHAVAKGVITRPDQLHVSYVHSPMRYAWDLQHQYLRESGLGFGPKGMLARWMLHRLRLWDVCSANRVDKFIANSHFIAQRIRKAYRRDAEVIYPPVDVEHFAYQEGKEDFFLTASRMVPYKRIDLIVEAFAMMPEKQLVVIGDGPEMAKIKAKARANVELLGYQTNDILRNYLQRTKAFVFAAEEDFGILPVEAQACGTPVIAYGRGGVRETVRDLSEGLPSDVRSDATGILFSLQSVESIMEAVTRFERQSDQISPKSCRVNALRFSVDRFRSEFIRSVSNQVEQFLVGAHSKNTGVTLN